MQDPESKTQVHFPESKKTRSHCSKLESRTENIALKTEKPKTGLNIRESWVFVRALWIGAGLLRAGTGGRDRRESGVNIYSLCQLLTTHTHTHTHTQRERERETDRQTDRQIHTSTTHAVYKNYGTDTF